MIRAFGGVARWKNLQRAGVRTAELNRALAAGSVRKSGYGVYALPDAPAELEAAVLLGGQLTCVSAAKWHGLWLRHEPRKPHVLVRKQTTSGSSVLHRHDGFRGSGFVVPVPEAVRQVCECLCWEESLIVAEAAVSQGKMTTSEVLASLRPGTRKHFERHLEGTAQSILEVEVRRILRCAGYRVRAQVRIRGVGVVDLVVEDRLVIELDGFSYHSARNEYRADRRRWNELTAQGYQVLRFTYETIMGSPQQIVALVERTLAEAESAG